MILLVQLYNNFNLIIMGNNLALGQQGQGGGGYYGSRDDVSVEIVDQEVMRRQRKQATYPKQQQPLNLHKRELTPKRDYPNYEHSREQSNKIHLSPIPIHTNKSTDQQFHKFKIMGQSEFDYWKRKANALAVEALKNSDTIPWQEFKQKLEKALQYYDRTPSFDLLYRDSSISENGILISQNNGHQLQKVDEDKKKQILTMFNTMKLGGKETDGPLYVDEIFRIQKSKGVIVRALIQNLYIQMQGSFTENQVDDSNTKIFSNSKMKASDKTLNEKRAKQMDELLRFLLQFTDINNLTIQFVVEQLGEQHIRPLNVAALSANSADSRKILKYQKSKAVSERFRQLPMGRINDPGPGGSPNDIQESSSVNIVSPRNLLNGSRDNRTTPKSCSPAVVTSKEGSLPAPGWAKRYIEALQSCQFLFQDKFIKSLLQNEKDFRNKLDFLKTIYTAINPYNYEYLRKISWYISKTYYKKAVYEQNRRELETSEQDNLNAALFLRRFEEFTQSMEENSILSEAKFMAQDNFNEITGDEVEKHRVRIDNLQNIITYLLQNYKVLTQTDKSLTSSQNFQRQKLESQNMNNSNNRKNTHFQQLESETPPRQQISQDLLEQTPSQMHINHQDNTSSKDRSNMTLPPMVTASQPIEKLVDPPLFASPTQISQQQMERVRTRRLSSYERESSIPEQYQTKRRDNVERSPLSKLNRTPDAQIRSVGDINDGDLAIDPEEEEATVFIQTQKRKSKVQSRADTGSSIVGTIPFKSGASREEQTIKKNEAKVLEQKMNLLNLKKDMIDDQSPNLVEASSAPETNYHTSSKEPRVPRTVQSKKQKTITKILVDQPVINGDPSNFNMDQPTPSSYTTPAILNLELENKNSMPVKQARRKSKKNMDKTYNSESCQRPMTERSKAMQEAEKLRAQKQELSKAILPPLKIIKANSKLSKQTLDNTEKSLLRGMIVKLPEQDKNEVLSNKPPSRSRSKTPKALLKERPPSKQSGFQSPPSNISRPSYINSTQTQLQLGRRKIQTERADTTQQDDVSTIKQPRQPSTKRISKPKASKKQTNINDVTAPTRRPQSPIQKGVVKVNKKPMYLAEPVSQIQQPMLPKQKKRIDLNQKSFAIPLQKKEVNKKNSNEVCKQINHKRAIQQPKSDISNIKVVSSKSKIITQGKAPKQQTKAETYRPLSPSQSRPMSPRSTRPMSPGSSRPMSPRPFRPISPRPNQVVSPRPARPLSPRQQRIKEYQKVLNKRNKELQVYKSQQLTIQKETLDPQANIVVDIQANGKKVVQNKFVEPQGIVNKIPINQKQVEPIMNSPLSSKNKTKYDSNLIPLDCKKKIENQSQFRNSLNATIPLNQEESIMTLPNTVMTFQNLKTQTTNKNRNIDAVEETQPLVQSRKHLPSKEILTIPSAIQNQQNSNNTNQKGIDDAYERQSAENDNLLEQVEQIQNKVDEQVKAFEKADETNSVNDDGKKLKEESRAEDAIDIQTQNLVEASIRISSDNQAKDEKSEITTGKVDNQLHLKSQKALSESLPQSELAHAPQGPFISNIKIGTPSEQDGVSQQVKHLRYQIDQDPADIEPVASSQSVNRTTQMLDPSIYQKDLATDPSKNSNKTAVNKKQDNNQLLKKEKPMVDNPSKIKSDNVSGSQLFEGKQAQPSKPIQTKPRQQPSYNNHINNEQNLYQDEEQVEEKADESPRFPAPDKKTASSKRQIAENVKEETQVLIPIRRQNAGLIKQQYIANSQSEEDSHRASSENNLDCGLLKGCMRPSRGAQGPPQKKASRGQRASLGISEQDFEPLVLLGSGSFGDVFLVRLKSQGQYQGPLYAMKALQKRSNKDEAWLRYVKTERNVMAYTDHPFVCKLWYAFQTRQKLFLVMDFCPGGDLEAMMANQKAPFSEEKAKFYAAEILLALKDLHSRDIIYRDLKPDNVVIDEMGHARLIDFGMTKNDVKDSTSGAKTFCGSIKYLAPEMLKKAGHGQALDWYLLGVLLFEMIIGATPYFSNNKETLFNNILYGNLKFPRTISTDLKDLLTQLLKRSPSKRLGSAPGEEGAQQIMSHAFFNDMDWSALKSKDNNGTFSYWPQAPAQTIKHFQAAYPKTQLSQSDLYYVYNADDDDEEGEDEWTEDRVEDEPLSDLMRCNTNNKISQRSQVKSMTWRQESDDFQNYVEDWDFIRTPEEPTPVARPTTTPINKTQKQPQQQTKTTETVNKQTKQNQMVSNQKTNNGDLRKVIKPSQVAKNKPEDNTRKNNNQHTKKQQGILK